MRNLHNALLARTAGVPACRPAEAQNTHAVCNASFTDGTHRAAVRYLELSTPPPPRYCHAPSWCVKRPWTLKALAISLAALAGLGKNGSRLEGCGAVALNVGQWLAAGYAEHPWTPAAYYQTIGWMMDLLVRFGIRKNVPVAWLATQPFPLNHGRHGHRTDQSTSHRRSSNLANCPATDWRYPHVLEAYNIGAQAAARARNLKYIDLWTAAFDVFELSFDDLHYTEGPVGDHHASLVVDWVLESRGHVTAA